MKKIPWKLIIILLAIIGVLVAFKLLGLQVYLERALEWIESLGALGPVIFIALYVVLTILLLPASVVTLGAGALFGVVVGTVYVSIASTAGAACSFLIGRYLARDWVAKKIEANPKFKAVDQAVGKEGWKIVALTRLSPVFPFVFLNYAFGLTRVSFRGYILASWICMLPGTVMYIYFGSLAKEATVDSGMTTGDWIKYGIGLVATVAVTIYITRIAKKALSEKTS